MSVRWTDTTSYQQGDTKRVPTTWSTGPGSLGGYIRIFVTKGHIDYPDVWVYRVMPFMSEPEPLELPAVAEADVAQERAVEHARDIIAICTRALR